MPDIDSQNLAFNWSTLFVRTLYEEGVRHAVLSPGSRSTALTLAFSAHPGIQKHIGIDERSAAFMAMGIGKESGTPAVLVCTSGTAVANYYPAVIEAAQSHVPLIIASADRPPHYRSVGASQTIDQLKIFGDYPVFFHETGEPAHHIQGRKRLALAARQGVRSAIEQSGVSHLNFAFSKPFEPDPEVLKKNEDENTHQVDQGSRLSYLSKSETLLDEDIWSKLASAERPLIVVGPSNVHEQLNFISPLAHALNAPVLAEPGSGIPSSQHTLEGFDGFLRNTENLKHLNADLILRFGQHPVSKAVNTYLEIFDEVEQVVFRKSGTDLMDGSLTANTFISLDGSLHVPEVHGSADKNWLGLWKNIEKEFKAFRSDLLHPSTPLTDGFVFTEVSKALPENSFTMISNSFPVRDMSLFGAFDGKEIHLNRGAAGIDGITSTAMGISISSDKAGVLMIGDIAFLHDTNALLMANEIQKPLVIVVINNGGGTIFRMLPVHKIQDKYTSYFETPQSAKIAAICQAHQIDHTLISKPDQIIPTFDKLIGMDGIHVMECMTGADESMEQREQLWNFKAN